MFSGGKIVNSKPVDPSAAIKEFVRVVGEHVPSLGSLQRVANSAVNTGETVLRKACLGLQALAQPSNRKLAGMIHNPKAPKSIQPDRARVLGGVLTGLGQSSDPGAKALAVKIGRAWFKEVANDIGVQGRYDNGKKA